MFNYCKNLSNINLSSFNLSDNTNINKMFDKCYLLVNINSNNIRLINELEFRFSLIILNKFYIDFLGLELSINNLIIILA